jgi:hypothetical protein
MARDGGPSMNFSSVQSFVQIVPVRIVGVNEPNLPSPWPFLNAMFSPNGIANILVERCIDQPFRAVFLGEPFDDSLAMFPRTARNRTSAFLKNASWMARLRGP